MYHNALTNSSRLPQPTSSPSVLTPNSSSDRHYASGSTTPDPLNTPQATTQWNYLKHLQSTVKQEVTPLTRHKSLQNRGYKQSARNKRALAAKRPKTTPSQPKTTSNGCTQESIPINGTVMAHDFVLQHGIGCDWSRCDDNPETGKIWDLTGTNGTFSGVIPSGVANLTCTIFKVFTQFFWPGIYTDKVPFWSGMEHQCKGIEVRGYAGWEDTSSGYTCRFKND